MTQRITQKWLQQPRAGTPTTSRLTGVAVWCQAGTVAAMCPQCRDTAFALSAVNNRHQRRWERGMADTHATMGDTVPGNSDALAS